MANYQLNVVLHGLWGIETTQDNGIRIVTIDEHHHEVKAGTWNSPEYDLPQECKLENEGLVPGLPADFNAEQNATVTPSHSPPPRSPSKDDVKTVIKLPYPREIHSVRRVDTQGKPPFFKD